MRWWYDSVKGRKKRKKKGRIGQTSEDNGQQWLTPWREAKVQYGPFLHISTKGGHYAMWASPTPFARAESGAQHVPAQDTELNSARKWEHWNLQTFAKRLCNSIIEEEMNNSRPDGWVNMFAVHYRLYCIFVMIVISTTGLLAAIGNIVLWRRFFSLSGLLVLMWILSFSAFYGVEVLMNMVTRKGGRSLKSTCFIVVLCLWCLWCLLFFAFCSRV